MQICAENRVALTRLPAGRSAISAGIVQISLQEDY